MKASILIERLQTEIIKHGVLEVYRGDTEEETVMEVIQVEIPCGTTTRAFILW